MLIFQLECFNSVDVDGSAAVLQIEDFLKSRGEIVKTFKADGETNELGEQEGLTAEHLLGWSKVREGEGFRFLGRCDKVLHSVP
jgi:hypothetical protein